MANKVKYGYGSRANLEAAISSGKLDSYDILLLSGENEKPAVGWLDKNGNPVIVDGEKCVITVKGNQLPPSGEEDKIYIFNNEPYIYDGSAFVNISKSVDLSELEEAISNKVTAEEVDAKIKEAVENSVEVIEF